MMFKRHVSLALCCAATLAIESRAVAEVFIEPIELTADDFEYGDYGSTGLQTVQLYVSGLGEGWSVLSVSGVPGRPMTIASIDGMFNGPQVGQGHSAPGEAGYEFIPELQWDSWLAIGSKPTTTSPTFPDIVLEGGGGNIIGHENAVWFNANPGDPALEEDGRVLIGQFTFDELGGIYFAANIQMIRDDGTELQVWMYTFYGDIPSPGALALLGFTAMMPHRRRRN